MKTGQPRGRMEEPKYSIPERHAPKNIEGTNAHGNVMTNQVYRQPWVEHDGVLDPDGDMKTG